MHLSHSRNQENHAYKGHDVHKECWKNSWTPWNITSSWSWLWQLINWLNIFTDAVFQIVRSSFKFGWHMLGKESNTAETSGINLIECLPSISIKNQSVAGASCWRSDDTTRGDIGTSPWYSWGSCRFKLWSPSWSQVVAEALQVSWMDLHKHLRLSGLSTCSYHSGVAKIPAHSKAAFAEPSKMNAKCDLTPMSSYQILRRCCVQRLQLRNLNPKNFDIDQSNCNPMHLWVYSSSLCILASKKYGKKKIPPPNISQS